MIKTLQRWIKAMGIDELKQATELLKVEIESRTLEKPLVSYRHDSFSAAYCRATSRRPWCLLITKIDIDRNREHAFCGRFLKPGRVHKVPIGSIIVEFCGKNICAYMVKGNYRKKGIARCECNVLIQFMRACEVLSVSYPRPPLLWQLILMWRRLFPADAVTSLL